MITKVFAVFFYSHVFIYRTKKLKKPKITLNKREPTFTGPLQYTIGQTDPDVYPDTDTDMDTDTDTDTDVYP